MKVCRICLTSEGRLYAIENQLDVLYKQLTGLDNLNNRLPQWVCAECGLRLMSYHKLRQKSLRSHNLLSQILGKSKNITKKTMLRINSLRQPSTLTFSETNLAVYNPNIDNQEEHNLSINNLDSSDLLEPKEEKVDLLDNCVEIEFETVNTKADDSSDLKNDSDSLKADDFDSQFDTDSIKEGIESVYCEIEYLEMDETEEDRSNAPMESDKEYLPSDSSENKPPLTKKRKLKKIPFKRSEKNYKHSKKELNVPVKVNREDELDQYFTITQMSFREQLGDIERRKDSPGYAVANYKCEFCYKFFTLKEPYDDHMFKHSSESGELECLVCKIRCKTAYVLNNHMRRSHSKQFKCNSCDFVTSVRGSAVRHGKIHTGAMYLCPYCVRQFNDVTTYWRHIRMRHNTSAYVCAACGHSFHSARGLLVHRVKKHPGIDFKLPMEGPRCEKCSVTFASEEAYNTHLRVSVKHKEEHDPKEKLKKIARRKPSLIIKPNPCEECGVQMRSFKAYIDHFRRFHPDGIRTQHLSIQAAPSMCDLCGLLLQDSASLEKHMLSKHGSERTLVCKDCPQTFSKAAYLTKHYKKAHNKYIKAKSESSTKSSQCPQCGKIMASKESLRAHLKTHDSNREKKFPCKLCGKSFYLNCRLERHMTIHQEKSSYKCNYCDKECYTKIELYKHNLSSHDGKKYINIAKIKIK